MRSSFGTRSFNWMKWIFSGWMRLHQGFFVVTFTRMTNKKKRKLKEKSTLFLIIWLIRCHRRTLSHAHARPEYDMLHYFIYECLEKWNKLHAMKMSVGTANASKRARTTIIFIIHRWNAARKIAPIMEKVNFQRMACTRRLVSLWPYQQRERDRETVSIEQAPPAHAIPNAQHRFGSTSMFPCL